MEVIRGSSRAALRQALSSSTRQRQTSHLLLRNQIQSTFRTRPLQPLYTRYLHNLSKRPILTPQRTFSRAPTRRWDSTDAELASKPDSELSLGQRIKKLSREYGWAALYIYFALSALDFPFCFLAVKMLGTDLIGHWEHVIVTYVKGVLQWPLSGTVEEQVGEALDKVEEAIVTEDSKRLLEEGADAEAVIDHGYKEAERANSGKDASIWTQLALAYAIHKSFIFVRVPLTAAVTPKIVKTLRGWGWNIGRPTRKAKKTSAGNASNAEGSGVNTKGSGVKDD